MRVAGDLRRACRARRRRRARPSRRGRAARRTSRCPRRRRRTPCRARGRRESPRAAPRDRRRSRARAARAARGGPTIAWIGSMLASRCSSRRGGTCELRFCTICERCASRRSDVWPGSRSARRAEHPDEHEPGRGAEEDAAGRVEQAERRQLQPAAEERAGERRERWSSIAPASAPTRLRNGVHRELDPPLSRCGASRDPAYAPATSPPSEKRAHDEPSPPAAERREDDDRERDPVDGRHAASVAAPSARAPGYNAASTGA